jgi:hypothetical protein
MDCTRETIHHAAQSHINEPDTGLSVAASPGKSDDKASPDSISVLIATLKTLGGEYRRVSYDSLDWVLSKEQAPVFHRIEDMGDAAIAPLIQCIGDSIPTQTMIQHRAVPLGVLCDQALNRMIYHEEPTATGDMDPNWAGDINPQATAVQLRDARQAWQRVVKEGTYSRN